MAEITEGARIGEFIIHDPLGSFCREEVTITGGDYLPGKVLGKITASGKYTEHDPGAADGSEDATAVLYAAVDASAADAAGVIIERGPIEVDGDLLTWITGISAGDKTAGVAALTSNNIKVR